MSSTSTSTVNKEENLLSSKQDKYKCFLKRILSLKAIFPNGDYAKIFDCHEKSQKVICRLCCIEMEYRDILNHISWKEHLLKIKEYRTSYTNESTKKLILFLNSLNIDNPQEREFVYSLIGFCINSIASLKESIKVAPLPPHYLNQYKKYIDRRTSDIKSISKEKYKNVWYTMWPIWLKRVLHLELRQYKFGLQKKYNLSTTPPLQSNFIECFKDTAVRITHTNLLKEEVLVHIVPNDDALKEREKQMASTKENKSTINDNTQQDCSNTLTNVTCEKQQNVNKTEKIKESEITVSDEKQNSLPNTPLKSILKNKTEPAKTNIEENKLAADEKQESHPAALKSILKKKSEPLEHINSNTPPKLNNEKIQFLQFIDDDEDDYCMALIKNQQNIISNEYQNKFLVSNQSTAIKDSDVVPHKKIKINLLNKAKPNTKNVDVITVESVDNDNSDGLYVEKPKLKQVVSLKPKENAMTINIFEKSEKNSHTSNIPNRFLHRQIDNKNCFSQTSFTTRSTFSNCLMFADDEDM